MKSEDAVRSVMEDLKNTVVKVREHLNVPSTDDTMIRVDSFITVMQWVLDESDTRFEHLVDGIRKMREATSEVERSKIIRDTTHQSAMDFLRNLGKDDD